MAQWRECCRALDRAENLDSVYLWLDTVMPGPRSMLSSVPHDGLNPYVFGETLASILTVDVPVNPDKPDVWKKVALVEPRFATYPRGWPPYLAHVRDSKRSRIFRNWDWAEPGGPPAPRATVFVHPGQDLLSALLGLMGMGMEIMEIVINGIQVILDHFMPFSPQ